MYYLQLFYLCFFFYWYGEHRDLHVLTPSCPTRRSSDLEFIRNGGSAHDIADTAGNKVELELHLRMFGAHRGAQAREQRRHAIVQRQAGPPFGQPLLRDEAVRATARELDHLVQVGRYGIPVLGGQKREIGRAHV